MSDVNPAAGDEVVLITRVFDAFREEVFRAWTDPEAPVVVRVEFHDHGPRTRTTLSDGPYPSGSGHAEAGWNAALDKLAALRAA